MDKTGILSARNARFWQDLAEEAWSMASRMPEPEHKATLVEIAERYDLLAGRVHEREIEAQARGSHTVAITSGAGALI